MRLDKGLRAAPVERVGLVDDGLQNTLLEPFQRCLAEILDQIRLVLVATGFESC